MRKRGYRAPCHQGMRIRRLLMTTFALLLAACAETPQRHASSEVFRDTRILETRLTRGTSTTGDIRRLLGAPTGSGAVFLANVQHAPQEIWFYQDIELTDMKALKNEIDLKIRQQILIIFVRDQLFDGFMWFSNEDEATAWVKDALQGRVAR